MNLQWWSVNENNKFSKISNLYAYILLSSIISECQFLQKQTWDSWLEQPDQAAVLTGASYWDFHK